MKIVCDVGNVGERVMIRFRQHVESPVVTAVVNAVICRGARSEVKFWSEHFGKRRPKVGVVILGIFDLEGEVGWGGCNSGGGEGVMLRIRRLATSTRR